MTARKKGAGNPPPVAPEDVRAALEAAFRQAWDTTRERAEENATKRRLQVLPACDEGRLKVAVALLAVIAAELNKRREANAPTVPAEPFRTVGTRRVREELESVAIADLDALPDILRHLHAPTIAKLADAGFTRGQDVRRAGDAARRAINAPDPVQDPVLAAIARRVQEMLASGMMERETERQLGLPPNSLPPPPPPSQWEPPFEGRPRDNFARGVAAIVVGDYEGITGVSPRIPDPPGLVALVAAVFAILGISANPRASVAAAL